MPARRVITDRSREPRQRFAEELKAQRARSGETLRQLEEILGWDSSLFGKMENGHTLGGPEVVEALDQHYGTAPLLVTLWELAVEDKTHFIEQYRTYMKHEADAASLWQFAVSVVPGLAQTETYSWEVMVADGLNGDELEQQIRARLGRRERLMEEDGPHFRAILAESVLRTTLREKEAWREQLTLLLELAVRPNITFQVLPMRAGLHALISTDIIFLRMPDGRLMAYAENAHGGQLVKDSASVERLQRGYDAVRDMSLSPAASQKFIGQILEEVPCDPST
ncbi:helix-turn-helix transcriptional regulator [Streptomyces sp. NPDC048290]|uniref:helix-turn-helix domain-containing protein n=1 Tax=Streptomyces sp. NPDC048290 TaxID=3155811 RepID=UPI0034295A5C